MFITCKHSNCAVCTDIKEREVFKEIFQDVHPDTYLCKHAAYKITNRSGIEFVISALFCVSKGQNGYYVRDMFSAERIYLNKDNFKVICTLKGECKKTPFVSEYIPKQKKTAD